MVTKKLAKKILKHYYTASFPGSFQGVEVFRKSLKTNADISISHRALRRVLKSSLSYQVNIKKPKKFKTRALYSKGVYQESYTDPIFIPYQDGGQAKRFMALIAVDAHSRMVYSTTLTEVRPSALKAGFSRLFKNGMPEFPIIRCDRDASLNTLARPYFSKLGILLIPRRSVHHMGFLEGIIKNLKRKFIQSMRKNEGGKRWSPTRLGNLLKDITESINQTVSSSHGFPPASVNFPEFDPVLREKLYGPVRIQRFEDMYRQQLKLRRKANTPRQPGKAPNFDERPDSFKKGDLIYIDFEQPNVGRSAYKVQRGKLYEIARVNVLASPYLYKLMDIHTKKELYGWYYGRELARADLSELEIEEVLKEKTTKDGRTLIYVKYKDHDSSFNRWTEKR